LAPGNSATYPMYPPSSTSSKTAVSVSSVILAG
jgi:hypothetical protein